MSNVAVIIHRKGTQPVSLEAQSSVLDALKIMAEKNIGSIVVTENGNYVGIFTERDYSRNVILKNRHSYDTKLSEVMSKNIPKVKLADTLDHCMELMSESGVKYLPVFEGDEMKNIISMSDIIKQTMIQQRETISQLENYIQG